MFVDSSKERHQRSPNAGQALEIAAHVTQGRQYFEAAADAANLTRPLLLYYGVLSLSRAVILCGDLNKREANLEGSHGLSCGGWGAALASGLARLPEMEITITGGTFAELAQSTRNVERSTIYSFHKLRSAIVQEGTNSFNELDQRYRITLKDLLGRIPDLLELYQLTFNDIGACYPAYIQKYHDIQMDYYLIETRNGLPDTEHLRKVFGLPPDFKMEKSDYDHRIDHVPGVSFLINRDTSPVEVRDILLPIKNDSSAFPYVVEPLPGDLNLSSLSLLFIISHAMGTLVRYHPSHWAAISGPSTGSKLFPLLSLAARVVEGRFPQLVLEEIEQSHLGALTYRHPSFG